MEETKIPNQSQSTSPTPIPPGLPLQPNIPTPANDKPKVDINSLIYKTMPRGYAPPPAEVGVKNAPPQVAGQAATVKVLEPFLNPDLEAGETTEKKSFFKSKYFLYGALGVVVIIALGITAYYYFGPSTYVPKTPTVQTPTTNNNNTNNTTPTTPVSKIDSAWMQQYFSLSTCPVSQQSVCGDDADADSDGLTNYEEFTNKTNPKLVDTDGDGIGDGDEVHVFGTDPTTAHTSGVDKYTDAGDIRYQYNSKKKANFTDQDLMQIAANIKQYSLHAPTNITLTQDIINFYTSYISSSANMQKPGALDRDTQRQNTIKQIGYALLKYQQANGTYPNTLNYDAMIVSVKPLLQGVAVNTTDPTNVAPYLYSYQQLNNGSDFTLGYYSEVQNQPVTYNSKDIKDFNTKDQSTIHDTQRETDLDTIRQALLLYSGNNANISADPNATIFPTADSWKTALVPKYLTKIPTDPVTHQDYIYTVNTDNSDFALQTQLEGSYNGNSKYLCNTDGCKTY